MSKMKVTYMSKSTGHGDMGDKHTFIRCDKCDGKYVKELNKSCIHCDGKGLGKDPKAEAIFKAAVEKAAAKKVAADKDAEIAAEVAADNAAEAKAKK